MPAAQILLRCFSFGIVALELDRWIEVTTVRTPLAIAVLVESNYSATLTWKSEGLSLLLRGPQDDGSRGR